MNFKVSIIIPVYNVQLYIERCARSLFEQTLDSIEYIFVDDASPDNSINVLKKVIKDYPQRAPYVQILTHDHNQGLAAARNTGLSVAKGQYIAHCDSDDWISLNMYEKLYTTAINFNCDVVSCDLAMHFPDRIEVCRSLDIDKDKLTFLKHFIGFGWTVVCNLLVRKEVYFNNDIAPYIGLDFGEDYGLSVRIMYHAKNVYHIGEPLYQYNRMNQNSLVNNANTSSKLAKTTMSQIEIYKNINRFFIDKGLYSELLEVLSWRMLCAKRGLIFDFTKRKFYLDLFPESNNFIDSNPLCSKRDKFCQKAILKPYWWIVLKCMDYTLQLRNLFMNCKHSMLS